MNWKKWLPWNWFKKDEEAAKVPVTHTDGKEPDNALSVNLFHDIRRDFDRMWQLFFPARYSSRSDPLLPELRSLRGWAFRSGFDLTANADAYQANLEVPGMDPNDLRVEVRQGTVVISGEKREQSEERSGGLIRTGIRHGRFCRTFALPEDADGQNIEARYRHGVLTVTIPRLRSSSSVSRLIEVKAA